MKEKNEIPAKESTEETKEIISIEESAEMTVDEEKMYQLLQAKKMRQLEIDLLATKAEMRGVTKENIELREDLEQTKENLNVIADTRSKYAKYRGDYFVQTALGEEFAPAIGTKMMGKLLQIVGICQLQWIDKSYRTKPFETVQRGNLPLAKRKPDAEYPTWMYHRQKVMEYIQKWLEENDLWIEFNSHETQKQRHTFINELYEQYV